jgi:hypothetical protein
MTRTWGQALSLGGGPRKQRGMKRVSETGKGQKPVPKSVLLTLLLYAVGSFLQFHQDLREASGMPPRVIHLKDGGTGSFICRLATPHEFRVAAELGVICLVFRASSFVCQRCSGNRMT